MRVVEVCPECSNERLMPPLHDYWWWSCPSCGWSEEGTDGEGEEA